MHASEQTNGRLVVKELPGLKSVASAIAAPASTSARAGGIGRSRKSALAGSSTPTTPLAASAATPRLSGRLEVIDRASAQLDRQRDRTGLRELVAVQAQGEPGGGARFEEAPCLGHVERASFEEHVRRVGERGRLGQHLAEREVEVRVGVRELGRHRMRAEPGRRATRGTHRTQRVELGRQIEPVAGFALPRRRAVSEQPVGMARHPLSEPVGAECPRRGDGREDAAARGMELLVARADCPQRELLDPVAAPRRVGVTVDQARDRAQAGAVELLDPVQVADGLRELAHPPDRLDPPAVAEDECIVQHLDGRKLAPAARQRAIPGRRGELGEPTDEEPSHDR